MDFLFIAIPLPKNLKSQLERLCFGLPSIFWEEPENFQIIISQLGSTEGTLILDIKEKLKELEFPQFSLSLSGIGCTRKKGGSGVLWAGVEENPQLNKLRAAINKSLEDLPIQYDRSHIPRITLARYEK